MNKAEEVYEHLVNVHPFDLGVLEKNIHKVEIFDFLCASCSKEIELSGIINLIETCNKKLALDKHAEYGCVHEFSVLLDVPTQCTALGCEQEITLPKIYPEYEDALIDALDVFTESDQPGGCKRALGAMECFLPEVYERFFAYKDLWQIQKELESHRAYLSGNKGELVIN
jgi:hypothetical protein